ncbi:MAG: ComEC/Rec2 family competence protein [Sphingomicrobium sp.]
MKVESAPNIAIGGLPQRRFDQVSGALAAARVRLETFLEQERGQLPAWSVVGFGIGIGCWFALDGPNQWSAFLSLCSGIAVLALLARGGRAERAVGIFSLAMALGCALIWVRATWVAAPRIERPIVATFQARVERVEQLLAKGRDRLTIAPTESRLPPRVRVTVDGNEPPAGVAAGALLQVRARLAPPPGMALPGSYDFSRDAWFRGIGAVGKALDPPTVVEPVAPSGLDSLREQLGAHIRTRLSGSEGGIATALVTGDQNAVSEDDAEAMRRSGLTHLLSVSGLHIAAVVGATLLLTLRLLALSERLALRFNLMIVAAGAGAVAGVAYTLLTGAQVPTVRSCVTALLVLAGIALGRDAISIRLVAVAALLVLLFRPEAIAGASFQLSFAAVTAIIALHSTKWAKNWFLARDEWIGAKLLRSLGAMVVTGLAVEMALVPFALFHFHRAGLYGVGANIIAIPLTTFVIMPLEAAALLLDIVGVGAPLWALTGWALQVLLGIARTVSATSGAVATLATMPGWAFALLVGGGLWICLWATRPRIWGIIPVVIGASGAMASPTPDLLVTGDGRHVAIVQDGKPYLLRDRTGDYVRDIMSESAGFDGEASDLAGQSFSRCTTDSCVAIVPGQEGSWRVLATRSGTRIDWQAITDACADADIVISDRWLPKACTPRWLKLDRKALQSTGGLAIYLQHRANAEVDTVTSRVGEHPWAVTTGAKRSN